jgi:hypothetical protein
VCVCVCEREKESTGFGGGSAESREAPGSSTQHGRLGSTHSHLCEPRRGTRGLSSL